MWAAGFRRGLIVDRGVQLAPAGAFCKHQQERSRADAKRSSNIETQEGRRLHRQACWTLFDRVSNSNVTRFKYLIELWASKAGNSACKSERLRLLMLVRLFQHNTIACGLSLIGALKTFARSACPHRSRICARSRDRARFGTQP